jgi:predicted small integral membrane protein
MNNQNGFQVLFRKKDSKIGFRIQETGVFQEIDIGEIQYQYGFQMIWKKLFVLVQSKSYKSFQDVEKSMIFTDNLLMILQFLLNKEKES